MPSTHHSRVINIIPRVLGIMLIDAVFDANDNVILIFPTFDY